VDRISIVILNYIIRNFSDLWQFHAFPHAWLWPCKNSVSKQRYMHKEFSTVAYNLQNCVGSCWSETYTTWKLPRNSSIRIISFWGNYTLLLWNLVKWHFTLNLKKKNNFSLLTSKWLPNFVKLLLKMLYNNMSFILRAVFPIKIHYFNILIKVYFKIFSVNFASSFFFFFFSMDYEEICSCKCFDAW